LLSPSRALRKLPLFLSVPHQIHKGQAIILFYLSYLSKIKFSPQRRRGRRESIFCLAGDTAKQKGFRPFNASLIIVAIAIKRVRSSSRRDGVSDPIAVSSPSQRLSEPAADWIRRNPLSDLCGSAVSLVLKGANANQKVQ